MGSMKIGFVLDDGLDKPDGVQQYVLTLGRWLEQKGHEVHYLVGQTRRSDIHNINSLSRNVSVRFNQNRMSIPLGASKRRLKALLAQERFDVLHVQMPYSPLMAARVIRAASAGTAVVGTFHVVPFSRVQRMASRLLAVWLRPSLSRFDQVLSVSAAAREFAGSHFKIQSKVLPNVIDLASLRDRTPPQRVEADTFNIVFLGRLVPRKGCQELLEVLQYLDRKSSLPQKLRVTIAGSGPLEKKLHDFCDKSELSGMVRFVGYVEEHKKAELLNGADIAVFPSLGGESFGIVLIEAMGASAGVVMGGNNPGYSSVLGSWPECLFDPRDIQQFGGSMENIMANRELRARLHKAQTEAVKAYDVACVGPVLAEIYRLTIAKKDRS